MVNITDFNLGELDERRPQFLLVVRKLRVFTYTLE
jgi:hypothetical protein